MKQKKIKSLLSIFLLFAVLIQNANAAFWWADCDLLKESKSCCNLNQPREEMGNFSSSGEELQNASCAVDENECNITEPFNDEAIPSTVRIELLSNEINAASISKIMTEFETLHKYSHDPPIYKYSRQIFFHTLSP